MARLKTVEDFKSCVGRSIYGLPTGNNARGKNLVKAVKFDVLGCGRKYVSLRCGHFRPENYNPESGATQSAINSGFGCNAGYMFFESENDIAERNDKIMMIRSAREKLNRIRVDDIDTESLLIILSSLTK